MRQQDRGQCERMAWRMWPRGPMDWCGNPHQNRSGHIRHQSDTACHITKSQLRARSIDFDGPWLLPQHLAGASTAITLRQQALLGMAH